MADDARPEPVLPDADASGNAADTARSGGPAVPEGESSETTVTDHGGPAAGHPGLDVRALDVPQMSDDGSRRSDRTEAPPQIDGYEIRGRLGEGGQATVWRAEQLSTKREVALKVLGRNTLGSEKVRARFEREIELAARLRHTNIASVFDSGVCNGVYYYAMALIDGVSLDDYVEQSGIDQRQILDLMRTICLAVHHAHQRQVIHRDLKPSNILVTEGGQPYVVDFGLAKAFLEEDSGITLSLEGCFMGTPPYSSPEQAAGRHSEVDTRTDIYALGVILYRLLTRQSPHDVSGPLADVLYRIIREDVTRPREISRSVDRDLEAILLKALAKNPDDRYASSAAMAQDLQSYLDGEELAARAPMALDRLRRAIAKYPVALGIGLTLLALFIDVVVVGIVRIGEEHRAWEETRKELYVARFALSRRAYEQGDFPEASKQLLSCPRESRDGEWSRQRYDIQFALGKEAYERGDFVGAKERLSSCPEEFRDERWHQLRRLVPD